MSLEIRAPKADALARKLAEATGEDIDTAVVRAIEERLARTPRRPLSDERPAIEALFDRLARLPVLDRRPPDEIVGYDADGLPVAQLLRVEMHRKPVDLAALHALTESMPMQPEAGGDWLRALRDDQRYSRAMPAHSCMSAP